MELWKVFFIPSTILNILILVTDEIRYKYYTEKTRTFRLFTIYMKHPSGFKWCKWNAKISIRKSRSEHALFISRKIGKDRKYIVKGLELDGKPRKM